MKTIIIYNSKTGFTKKYAEWIAEELAAECRSLSEVNALKIADYDAIIFGGWAMGGSISKLKWFKEHMPDWEGKKLCVYCTGASPDYSPDILPTLKQNFTEDEMRQVGVFYCPAGLNYEKMSLPMRTMMKLFAKSVASKKDKTEYEEEAARMMKSSYDITDRKHIQPIIDYIRNE